MLSNTVVYDRLTLNVNFHFLIVITGVSSDCGSIFGGSNNRLTIGQHTRDLLQGTQMRSGQFHIVHPCINDNQHFSAWGG